MLMKGRVALVTGASRGIGAATAELLAANGAAVAVNFVKNEAAARSVVDTITSAGGRAIAVAADVRDRGEVDAMVEVASGELGPVDTLILNAAIQFPMVPFLEYPWEAFEAKLTGELGAAFFCCRSVAPAMVERGEGCIVAVSSGLSRQTAPGFCAHSAAKSGLDALMRSLAAELGPHGIRVNTVAPGLTITDATANLPDPQKDMIAKMTPLGRNALPEDVAGAILMVAGEPARFVNGAYIPVSGGHLMP
jgi:3-oxoacyl-[acyl-carrier protein] reductase